MAGDGRIHEGTVETAEFPDGYFDAITMWDVIEHMPSPREALLKIFRWLKPGGHLFVVTPDFGSRFARMCGRRWPHLIRQHLYYFDETTLQKLLAHTGFLQLHRTTYTRYFTLGYILQRSLLMRGMPAILTRGALGRVAQSRVPINLGDALFVVAQRPQGDA